MAKNELIMNPRTVLIAYNEDLTFGVNEIVIIYLLDGFPSIVVKRIDIVPRKIVFNHVGDVEMEYSIIGSPVIILRSKNETFTESQCNELSHSATFNSEFVDLDGKHQLLNCFAQL